MSQLLVRKVDEDLVLRLKQRAARAGRSAEAEHRLILEEALRTGKPSFAERARRHREALAGRVHTDSAELIREDRDRDYDNSWS
jgi:plasmid stability protein